MEAVLCLGEWAGYLCLGSRYEFGVLFDIAIGGLCNTKVKNQLVHWVVFAFILFRHEFFFMIVWLDVKLVVFKLSPCSECSKYSFGNFPGIRSIYADVSELCVGSIVLGKQLAQDNGTDTEFRNVGLYTSDAGETPKRILTTDVKFFVRNSILVTCFSKSMVVMSPYS